MNPKQVAQVSLALVLLLAGSSLVCTAQEKKNRLKPVQKKLTALDRCLNNGQTTSLSIAQELSLGLTYGWRGHNLMWSKAGIDVKPNVPDSELLDPPPQEYLISLDQDLQLCEMANQLIDEKKKKIVREAVYKDLSIKQEDCSEFGMGRLIPVNVNTLRDGKPEPGWEVLFKWVPAGPIATAELASPDLSSPAILHLAPGGTFQIRARKTGPDGKVITSVVREITIMSGPEVKCDIPL